MNTAKLKAAALAATPGPWRYQKTTPVTNAEISAENHTRVVNLLAGDVTPANSEFISLANPAAVLELIAALEAERADCRENAARIAEMESQRALAFSACNRWADKCRDAEKRVAELEREHAAFRPVGVMSEGAFHRLENSECRFIALWPRPGIYLPRKRPDDGVVVYARTELAGINLETGGEA
ncbi:hypothetical protein P2G56_17490 [Cronobacter malonaticus]|uniref:hypothetical protein n=1 Tax=Cronobacter malonaticus TaxID=413503 RepID=UPI002DBB8C5B|nr:hypothetical protein [Cronobacter malonaticus]MEB8480205.1 hypothetical protein [Cronobacter malonaticus]